MTHDTPGCWLGTWNIAIVPGYYQGHPKDFIKTSVSKIHGWNMVGTPMLATEVEKDTFFFYTNKFLAKTILPEKMRKLQQKWIGNKKA